MATTPFDPDKVAQQQRNEENTKKDLITPKILSLWPDSEKVVMEYYFTDGRISVDEYGVAHRGRPKKADYLLLFFNNVPLAVVEAKGQDHSADEGFQQAVDYARVLDVPFAYATNGHKLIEFDQITGISAEMGLQDLPGPEALWDRFQRESGLAPEDVAAYTYPYYVTASGKRPRYYQRIIIDRVTRALLEGRDRVLVVAATGTGKTYTAFQLLWRLLQGGVKRRILYLADRNFLIDQTMRDDFAPFEHRMVKIDNKSIDRAHEVYLGIYQQLVTTDSQGRVTKHYHRFERDFFDLVVVDECHRSSADSDSSWHEILDYFSGAAKVGLTATPKASDDPSRSNFAYFGQPIYTYSLKQGIEDGFLAPYKVVVPQIDIDVAGYVPETGTLDQDGEPVEVRLYTQREFDRPGGIIVQERREKVAARVTEYMRQNDMRHGKTIVFCESQEHAHAMARLIGNANADLMAEDPDWCVCITADEGELGKERLERFISNKSRSPVVACTSQMLSTGVNAKTCELVVLDRTIGSMTEFKQIIGRGTRVVESYEVDGEERSKMYFTLLDFRSNYQLFQDPAFDGDPTDVVTVPPGAPVPKPPIRPRGPQGDGPGPASKTVRVSGVDVEIVGEMVRYLSDDGTLVQQNVASCAKNNILAAYETPERFRAAWLLTKAKARMAQELLLDMDWSAGFEKRYGYAVDDFDVVLCVGYGADPPMSRSHRARLAPVQRFIDAHGPDQAAILSILRDAYAQGGFDPLRTLDVFSLPQFREAGWTKRAAVRAMGGKQGYFKALEGLENSLYEQ